jgi:hypothetical protein
MKNTLRNGLVWFGKCDLYLGMFFVFLSVCFSCCDFNISKTTGHYSERETVLVCWQRDVHVSCLQGLNTR